MPIEFETRRVHKPMSKEVYHIFAKLLNARLLYVGAVYRQDGRCHWSAHFCGSVNGYGPMGKFKTLRLGVEAVRNQTRKVYNVQTNRKKRVDVKVNPADSVRGSKLNVARATG